MSSTLLVRMPCWRSPWISSARRSSKGRRTRIARFAAGASAGTRSTTLRGALRRGGRRGAAGAGVSGASGGWASASSGWAPRAFRGRGGVRLARAIRSRIASSPLGSRGTCSSNRLSDSAELVSCTPYPDARVWLGNHGRSAKPPPKPSML